MATRAERQSRRAARRSKRKDKIASFRGDGNALKKKFGIGRSLSNRFDQRVGDALEDLISGAIGTRVSNIPDIEQTIKTSREDNRKLAAKALRSGARTGASAIPKETKVLVFPRAYFDERGEAFEPRVGDDYAMANQDQWDEMAELDKSTAFPNSINFSEKANCSKSGRYLVNINS